MTLSYSLSEDDFLQSTLFNASINDRIKKQRRKSYLINVSMMVCLAVLFIFINNKILAYYFSAFSVVFIFFFPSYQKWRYKRHYTKFIKDTYKNRVNITATLTITDEHITCDDISGTSKVNISEIEHIYETGQYFFLKLKSGIAFIIPKADINVL